MRSSILHTLSPMPTHHLLLYFRFIYSSLNHIEWYSVLLKFFNFPEPFQYPLKSFLACCWFDFQHFCHIEAGISFHNDFLQNEQIPCGDMFGNNTDELVATRIRLKVLVVNLVVFMSQPPGFGDSIRSSYLFHAITNTSWTISSANSKSSITVIV